VKQILNAKYEIRNKHEFQDTSDPKEEFGIWKTGILNLFRVSNFGFRIWTAQGILL
jgi:hypothetical protein